MPVFNARWIVGLLVVAAIIVVIALLVATGDGGAPGY
jgi:hypothetical protein